MKCPSTTRTAGCGSSRSKSKNAGMASLTASRSNGTCIDLHDCAVRLLSYCVAPFLSYCVETGPWSALGIAARTPLQIDSALLRSSLFQHLCSFVSFSSGGLTVFIGQHQFPLSKEQLVSNECGVIILGLPTITSTKK